MKKIMTSLLLMTSFWTMANQEFQMTKTKILVLYHSQSGKTAKLAEEIAEGIKCLSNVETTIKSITQISPSELDAFDGIAIGTPVYFGAMSGEMKTFLDKTMSIWKKKGLEGIPATVFVSFGSGEGKDSAIHNIWSVLSSHGMIILPSSSDIRTQGCSLAKVAQALKASQVELPAAPKPVGSYSAYKISGKQIYINQIALKDGKILLPGIIGDTVTIEEAKEATRQTALNIMAVLKEAVGGDLKKIKQAVQLTGYFRASPNFKNHSLLLNEASNILTEVLGNKGAHARAAIGSASLPLDSSNEIQAIFEMY
jgi:NAD(P)H dehydrogenase (quinone)